MFFQNIEELKKKKLVQACNHASELKPLSTDQVLVWLVISVQEQLLSHVSLCLDRSQIKEDFSTCVCNVVSIQNWFEILDEGDPQKLWDKILMLMTGAGKW